jgi:hypothetical protein
LDPGVQNDDRSWTSTDPSSEDNNVAHDVDPAPVFLIRDAATEVGVGTPTITDTSQSPQASRKIIDSIDASTARLLLEM